MNKIFLSPSRQSENKYAAGNTNEKAQCEKITTAAAAALERCGFWVFNAAGMVSYAERVNIAMQEKVDLYVPVHTNASAKHNVTGTRVFVRSFEDEPSYSYAKKIFPVVDACCPGKTSKLKTYKSLWEFNAQDRPSVYIECDFHDVKSIAEWIVNHTKDIGESICEGICDAFGVPYVGPAVPLKVGDAVRLRPGATNYAGTKTFAAWVYRSKLYLREVKGERAVISVYKTGAITGTCNVNDLSKY